MGDATVAVFGLEGLDAVLAVAAAASGALWLAAAGLLYLSRRPPEPLVGPKTLSLGPEPPAVVNFLVNDFRVTADAVPATLIDLAARNVVEVEQRGPGVFFIRLRPAEVPLSGYDLRVLEHLRRRASDGVVPADALTTGPGEESSRWRRAFDGEVVADAQSRGLARDALDGRGFTLLTLAAAVPALLTLALSSSWQAGALVVGGGVAILGWIRARHPQRETPDGLAAASRWLGVRAELAENEMFATHSPLTVELWDRLLAYGAALGVASGASRPLPMGTESDTAAWSAYGGRWRPVRVSYPRLWPPGWGRDPLIALVVGLGAAVAGGLALFWLAPALADALEGGWTGALAGAVLAVLCLGVVVGIALAVMALADLGSTIETTGPILRLRAFGNDESRRYFAAIDDGSSRSIRALRLEPHDYVALSQGDSVTVRMTKNLGCVRWIIPETVHDELVDPTTG